MDGKNLKLLIVVLMVATGLTGLAVAQFSKPGNSESQPTRSSTARETSALVMTTAPTEQVVETTIPRREQATIRMPQGSYIKEVDVAPYGRGRIVWTYKNEMVFGEIECDVMGATIKIATEAEIALSRNGTIFGLVNSIRISDIRFGGDHFGGDLAAASEYAKFLPLVEPLINELITDLPFSYQFRVHGDTLTILNFRTLLSGPNPLNKLALVGVNIGDEATFLTYFQALGLAMEGTYLRIDENNRPEMGNLPRLRR